MVWGSVLTSLVYTQWFKQWKFNIKGLWNYGQRVAIKYYKNYIVSEGWDWVFPRKAKFGRKTSSPRLSSYLTGEGEVASHGVPEKFSGLHGPGLICSKWAKKEATFGEPDVPHLAPWHAERRARQAQAAYRWASATDQGLACAERVRVPLKAGAPVCTASGWAGAARIWRGHTFWALG